jgi:hypothetical protein
LPAPIDHAAGPAPKPPPPHPRCPFLAYDRWSVDPDARVVPTQVLPTRPARSSRTIGGHSRRVHPPVDKGGAR